MSLQPPDWDADRRADRRFDRLCVAFALVAGGYIVVRALIPACLLWIWPA